MSELLPCPFCGCTAIYVTHTNYYDPEDTVSIFCNGCKAHVTLEQNEAEGINEKTKAAAIEAWNTRAERIEVYPFGMKVYICFSDNGESWEDYWYGIDSVHETYEGAKEAIERRGFHEVEERHNRRTWELKQGDWSTCSAWIEEWEVSK